MWERTLHSGAFGGKPRQFSHGCRDKTKAMREVSEKGCKSRECSNRMCKSGGSHRAAAGKLRRCFPHLLSRSMAEVATSQTPVLYSAESPTAQRTLALGRLDIFRHRLLRLLFTGQTPACSASGTDAELHRCPTRCGGFAIWISAS